MRGEVAGVVGVELLLHEAREVGKFGEQAVERLGDERGIGGRVGKAAAH